MFDIDCLFIDSELNPANTTDIAASDVSLLDCLREKLSENCVEFEESAVCNKVKRFKSKCPETSSVNDATRTLRSSRQIDVELHQQGRQLDENSSDTKLRSLLALTVK